MSSGVIVSKSGATSGVLLTAKGDLVTRGATTQVRKAVGTDDQILVADSTQTDGLNWQDAGNTDMAAKLVAGGAAISTHFPGTSVASGWNDEATASSSRTEKYSVLAVDAVTGNNHQLKAFVPGAATAFRHETKVRGWDGAGVGMLIRDSANGDATGEGMMVNTEAAQMRLYSLDAGTYTSRASYTITIPLTSWIYLRLDRSAADLWTGYFSLDRAIWTQIGTYTKTLTIAKAGYRLFGDATHRFYALDFYDAVS